MNINAPTVLWIIDYLTSRPQFVRMSSNVLSDVKYTDTGAPQGTVLSPFLFSLYTADCRSQHDSTPITKFADDTGLTGLITDDDDTHYRRQIDSFVDWCDDNYLQLNVGKTKEMIIDFRKKKSECSSIVIKGEKVERVKTYKYLGITFDEKLSWKQHVDATVKKAHSRLYCLRKLRSFDVRNDILQMFYTATIGSVLSFGLTCWGGNMTQQDRNRLDKNIKKAGGVVGRSQENIDATYTRLVTDRLQTILSDETHPLRCEFDSRRTDRSDRFRLPRTRTTRYQQSFIPTAIRTHNKQAGRHGTTWTEE